MKKAKMYIRSPKNRGMLLSANKISVLEKVLPCEEALVTHIQMQRIMVQKDESYRPEALHIQIKREIFSEIIRKLGEGFEKGIPLILQSDALPICIIESE